ncbi:histidine phosphatase family protein [Leptothoe sp. PORK10 BA2]|uniref:histidine phosphatase family protein n=1 Tax=Leptothoe sp. PORK10 BA2 TaxID=3110254 RepID=UPI002B20B69E|nr:histidine phosphatase family protein [Leptothoe sp. PORK10 BA2]MEA5463564.1 histidine phosphatase family protein [Leptothoe sp. PORK10 BA2]
MTNYLKLWLMRHGESLGNIDERLEGQMSTPLSPLGRWQAQQLAAYLHQQGTPTVLYSSPLQRAVETAHYLAIDRPVELVPAIQELHQGIFQGLTWAEASHRHPQVCAALTQSLDYRPVPGAETLMAAHQRAVSWYQTLWQRHAPGDVVWMVTHGGFMQQLIRVILGCDRTWQISIRHTALFEFWLLNPANTRSRQHNPECWKILKFNETPHLVPQDERLGPGHP